MSNWINFNKSFWEFSKAKKNKPGTLIETISNNKKKLFLIGDINSNSSKSNNEFVLNADVIITKYKIIYHNE